MRHSVFFYILVAIIGACIVGTSVFSTYEMFISEGPLTQSKVITLDKGMSVKQIGEFLKKEGVIKSSAIFVIGVRANGKVKSLKAGEYFIPARASCKMVMDILVSGKTYLRTLTIPEGLTSYQIVQLLNETEGLIGTIEEIPANGTLLPQTYFFSKGDDRKQMIIRMQNAMQRTLEELWPQKEEGTLATKKEVITLASIVEKESAIPDEQNHISAVFLNRLKKNMRLQSDPTVIFALTDGTGIFRRKLWSNDLKRVHPYNTYYINGLPPGAIANPGRGAIEAVLHPLQTDDLYFVADGTGGHVFANNYKTHLHNVNEWRKIKKNPRLARQIRLKKKQKENNTANLDMR